MSTARFLVGIDLGTTNSALAYVDTRPQRGARLGPRSTVQLFPVPQVTAPGEVERRETLPSFVYFPEDRPDFITGVFAREQGALLPTRQISSAKSWLCHPDVDRTARILPWGADRPFMSPVDASAAILAHLRNAWNETFAASGRDEWRLERQEIVLTVPASFDQEARELTLQAAREAGFEQVTLLEEPLAAFYAWMAQAGLKPSTAEAGLKPCSTEEPCSPEASPPFKDGDTVLVCDVGGGTSDFTLIRVHVRDGDFTFERTAVGEHLLLGGDNLDLALARRLEEKLGDRALTLVQRLALRRSASAAKERLLSDPSCPRVAIAVLGSGRSVVGGAMATELTRDEVIETLSNGFLPLVATSLEAEPASSAGRAGDRRLALRELGLPYADDPAITRHLAGFLQQAARAREEEMTPPPTTTATPVMVRPDAVLFNGGFFTPAVARERILQNLEHWFSPGGAWRPMVLENRAPAAAVALGAAHYALLRRLGAPRVRAGSSRGYYIGVAAADRSAVCILPRGTEEGTTFDLGDRPFAVMTNRPVSFPLFSSAIRHDPAGALVVLEGADVHAHAPLATVFRYGRKSRQVELSVALSATFTETGTLEVSCASKTTEHRWRLQFQLRGEREAPEEEPGADAESMVPPERLADAQKAITEVFVRRLRESPPAVEATPEVISPDALPAFLESTLGFGRHAWPLAVIRALADSLLDAADGRKKGPHYEARWLNLLGFCLRPGFGAPLDDWRVGRTRALYVEGLAFGNDLQCQAEWIVLWQRVAGGLKAGQQRELYQRYSTVLDVRAGGRAPRVNPQIQREAWRLLASLEHLSGGERAKLGDVLLERLRKDQGNASYLWAIGRLGARTPAHGRVTAVVPPDKAEAWMDRLLSFRTFTGETAAAVAEIGAPSDDRLRDISVEARDRAAARLTELGFAREAESLREVRPPASRNALQVFGEELPVGLRLTGDAGQ